MTSASNLVQSLSNFVRRRPSLLYVSTLKDEAEAYWQLRAFMLRPVFDWVGQEVLTQLLLSSIRLWVAQNVLLLLQHGLGMPFVMPLVFIGL
jgi:hypothetical protein